MAILAVVVSSNGPASDFVDWENESEWEEGSGEDDEDEEEDDDGDGDDVDPDDVFVDVEVSADALDAEDGSLMLKKVDVKPFGPSGFIQKKKRLE